MIAYNFYSFKNPWYTLKFRIASHRRNSCNIDLWFFGTRYGVNIVIK